MQKQQEREGGKKKGREKDEDRDHANRRRRISREIEVLKCISAYLCVQFLKSKQENIFLERYLCLLCVCIFFLNLLVPLMY